MCYSSKRLSSLPRSGHWAPNLGPKYCPELTDHGLVPLCCRRFIVLICNKLLETQCPLATTPNISLHFAKESGIVQVHWLKPYLLRKVLRWAYKPKGLMTLSHGHVLTTSNPSSKGNSLSLALIHLIRWSRSLLTWEPFCFLSHDFEYLSLGYILIFQCKSNFIHI